ncbi:hypothetical protein SH580_11565 [Coraliomargarita algicola]|uniref:DUF2259 domain-containing protein n=1 Tax=Coraliomargarita algicola TaxID=3092156 RepID=A0ABZ0RGK3_9BACT|nr:hypothetical protein [Coraliomargarita sp. J2-16]WPJ94072.1 hypothetical protein SH580_11565 [Coraliomargarita sp. J2-16]
MVRFITALITAIVFGASILHSQQAPTTIEFEFRVFGVGSDSFKGLYYFDGDTHRELKFHKSSRSIDTYSYKGILNFALFIRNPSYVPTNPNSEPYTQIAQAKIPTNIRESLLIIQAHPNNNLADQTDRKFELYFINDADSHFTRNSILIVNATGRDLIGRVGTTDSAFPRGISSPISYPDKEKSKTTRLAFALETEQGPRLVMSYDIQLSNNRRTVLVLLPPRDPKSTRISMRKLSQSIHEEEEPSQ